MPSGTRFEVKGSHFSLWPDEMVMTYAASNIDEGLPNSRLLRLVSKTDESLIFEVTEDTRFSGPHTFNIFCSPLAAPRTILEYDEM